MWRILFFLTFISEAKANLITVATDIKEEQKNAISTRLDEPRKEEVKGSEKIIEEPTQAIISISGEEEKTPLTFPGQNETSSAPGAILRTLDPKYGDLKVSFPVTEAPWWERWWFSIKEWWASEVTQ
jgi:hypothetical protein